MFFKSLAALMGAMGATGVVSDKIRENRIQAMQDQKDYDSMRDQVYENHPEVIPEHDLTKLKADVKILNDDESSDKDEFLKKRYELSSKSYDNDVRKDKIRKKNEELKQKKFEALQAVMQEQEAAKKSLPVAEKPVVVKSKIERK